MKLLKQIWQAIKDFIIQPLSECPTCKELYPDRYFQNGGLCFKCGYRIKPENKIKLMKTIKELRKNDRFEFNEKSFVVKKKYRNDDFPLVAFDEDCLSDHYFFNEDLKVVLLTKIKQS